MSEISIPRRTFLAGVMASGTAVSVGQSNQVSAHDNCVCEPMPDPDPVPLPGAHVRRSIYSLDPDGPEIAAFRTGVAAMMERPVDDPTSWLFQANVHGTIDSPPIDMPPSLSSTWSTCEHASYFFLSWHRMYLYFFDRILRDASGDPNFALPYWNYETPGQRALPEALRQPANQANPLFVSARRTFGPNINGGEPVPESVTSSSGAMSTIPFGTPTTFGFTRNLESQPHNIMHVVIGGSGWMSDPRFAARDPVFWLHHANIDRLWSRWKGLGGGREDPVFDTVWMETPFPFFDESGARIEMTGAEILDTINQLDYRYDDEPGPEIGLVLVASADDAGMEAASTAVELAVVPEEQNIVLGATPLQVELPSAEDMGLEAFATTPGAGARPVVLELGMIEYTSPPSQWYEVYINLPPGTQPKPTSPYFAGNLSFFAQSMTLRADMNMKGEHLPEQLDITGLLNNQVDKQLWSGGDVNITFVPRGNENPGLEAVSEDEQVKIGSLRIVRQ